RHERQSTVQQIEVELKLLIEDLGFHLFTAMLHAKELPVAYAVARKLGDPRRRDHRDAITDPPGYIRVYLEIIVLLSLPAQVFPIGIRAVQETEVRHREIVRS